MQSSILVAGCGNVMAGDDGFGPRVIEALREAALPCVEAVDLDLRPAALLDHLDQAWQGLILVDAVQAASSGELIEVSWFDPKRPALVDDDVLSTHGLSIANQIELARSLEMLPARVYLLGASISNAEVGDPFGLDALVPQAVQRIHRWVTEWVAGEAGHDVPPSDTVHQYRSK